MENRKISKIIEEVNEVVSSMTPAKKYISGKKLNAKTQKALSDIEKNHNTSWAVEIFRRNQENLDLISLLYRGNKISYEKMFTEAYDYAKSLKSIGYTKGDTIPICVDNIPEFVYLMIGASFIGCNLVVVGDWFNKEYLKEILNETKSKYIFVSNKNYVQINEAINESNIEEINNSARNIKGSTAKFTTMTNEILDILSIDSASVRIYNEKYNIKRLLKELVGIYKPKAQNKNLDFRVSIASDIPEYLYGDGINLKKVLTIILDNSIKYTNNGYIEFNINTIIKGDIVRLIISVEDSGIGMKAEDINKIFTKKQEREDNHNLNNNLYNAKRLITLMNGTIVPSSSYGSGTTIKIILDQKYDTIDTDINKYDNIYDKKKVLLIDDSPSSEKLFNKILSGTNIELTSVKLGKEGLEKIRNKEKYDLILLDEELEPQNGHIIMRKLLEIRNFNIKVILLTKDNKYDYDDSYLQEGFTDYIIKSSDKEEMLNKINKYLK